MSDSCSPAPGTGSLSAASSDGLWTLNIDEKPPPAVNLILFVPADPTSETQTLPVAAVHALPQTSPSPMLSNELLGVNAAVGVQLNASLEFIQGFTENEEAPLDLSKKCISPKFSEPKVPLLQIKAEPNIPLLQIKADSNIPLLQIKSEPKEFDVSEQVRWETRETIGFSTTKQCKTEPGVLSPTSSQTPSADLILDIKKSPESPGSGFDSCSSTCSKLTPLQPEKKIKMETDL